MTEQMFADRYELTQISNYLDKLFKQRKQDSYNNKRRKTNGTQSQM